MSLCNQGRCEMEKKDVFDKIMALPGLNIFESIYYKYKEVLLYLFFGGLTTVISIGSYSYCDVALHMNPLVANIISWILAVLFAYVTNKIWVFNAERHGVKEVFLKICTGKVSVIIMITLKILRLSLNIKPVWNMQKRFISETEIMS